MEESRKERRVSYKLLTLLEKGDIQNPMQEIIMKYLSYIMKDYKLCNRNVVNSAKTCCKGNREVLFRRTSACDALMTKCMGCHSWPCYFFHQVMILKQGKLSFSQKIREDSLFSFHQAWPPPLSAASALENPQTQITR